MNSKQRNRLLVLYTDKYPPYVYAAVQMVDGNVDNLRKERPFVLCKNTPGKEPVIYGTVNRTIQKIVDQIDRLQHFANDTATELASAGITPAGEEAAILPQSDISMRIMDEQEELIEDILLAISVHIRVLSEIFPQQLRCYTVKVLDYDTEYVGEIELKEIANLLVHQRYLLVKTPHVIDLISDRRFMSDQPQMGLKVDIYEYLENVQRVIDELTISNLIEKLLQMTSELSPSTNIKDIVFLIQNLYALGDSFMGEGGTSVDGPLKPILNRVANAIFEKMYPGDSLPRNVTIPTHLTFTTPRFLLEPDLDNKQIRTTTYVNGTPEALTLDYEEFFAEVLKAAGSQPLYTKPRV